MARGGEGERPIDLLEESLSRLRGIGAAVAAIGVAVEKEADACPRLWSALQILGELALDEVEVADKASEDVWAEVRAGRNLTEPDTGKGKARPD